MHPRPSIQSFLARARAALLAPSAKRVHPLTFVVGNESADLDSLCSAILYAYLRTHTEPHALHIPISNLPREDLPLRTEMAAVLRHANLAFNDLLTLSDLPSGADSLDPKQTKWVMVDHNVLTGPIGERYSAQVTGCVDHHVDEGFVPSTCDPRIIQVCGSCTSLIVEHCRAAWTSLAIDDAPSRQVDAQLAHIAIGPILSDTMNLALADKVTETDIRAMKFLEERIQSTNEPFNRTAYFNEITKLKEDLTDLSLRDILRKDYKQWTESGAKLGTCSITGTVNHLIEKAGSVPNLTQALHSFAIEKDISVLALLTFSLVDGNPHRELLIWGHGPFSSLSGEFERHADGILGLETLDGGSLDRDGEDEGVGVRRAWRQRGSEHSRKKIAPMLRDVMRVVGARDTKGIL